MKQQQVELEMQDFHTLLHNNKVVKVLHDCRQAAAALFYQKDITICNVFDTQVINMHCIQQAIYVGLIYFATMTVEI